MQAVGNRREGLGRKTRMKVEVEKACP